MRTRHGRAAVGQSHRAATTSVAPLRLTRRGRRLGAGLLIALTLALLAAALLLPLPTDRAARHGRLACDLAAQQCTTAP